MSLTIRLTIEVGNFSGDKRCFPLKKKFRFEISEISRAQRNGTVHSGYTDPTQATARLVIVLVSRGQQFCQIEIKGHFGMTDRSKKTTFKVGPEYSGRTKPKWSVPYDVPTEISESWG